LSWSRIVLSLTLWSFVSASAWAGSIGLRLDATTSVSTDLMVIGLNVANTGDEPAFELNPVIWIAGKAQRLSGATELTPGSEVKMTYTSLQHPLAKQGLYHLPLQIGYRDLMGAHFKLAYLLKAIHGQKVESRLGWRGDEIVLLNDHDDSDVVEVTLINLDERPKLVHLSKVNSMTIDFDLPSSPVMLLAGEEKTWMIKITHGNLVPNTYPNYLLASYIQDEIHYSEFMSIATNAKASSNVVFELFTTKNMTWALVVLTLFSLVFGYGPGIVKKSWQKLS
jgi:hypothetical protein